MASPITSGKQVMKRAADQKKGKTEELGASSESKAKAAKSKVAKKSKSKK